MAITIIISTKIFRQKEFAKTFFCILIKKKLKHVINSRILLSCFVNVMSKNILTASIKEGTFYIYR